MGKYLLAFFIVALLLGVGGYFIATKSPIEGESQASECALLVDRTDSTQGGAEEQQFLDSALQTVDGCRKKHADLTLFWFDQRSDKLVRVNAKPYQLWQPKSHNAAASKGALDDELDAARTAVKHLFEELPAGPERRTDLLTAMSGAAQFLRQAQRDHNTKESFLVTVTDGLQLSDSLTVESLGKGVTPAQLVAQAVKGGFAPNLDGVTLDMVGVDGGTSRSGTQLLTSFTIKVKDFWTAIASNGKAASLCYIPKAEALPADGPC